MYITFIFVCVCVERLEHRLLSKQFCPKKEGALASNEFISKFKIKAEHDIQIPEEHERLEEQIEAINLSDGSDDSQGKPNGQMWSSEKIKKEFFICLRRDWGVEGED